MSDCVLSHLNVRRGYARISVTIAGRRKKVGAHVIAWEKASGAPVPRGYIVCHTCDNRNCIQSDGEGVYLVGGIRYPRHGHLWLGTRQANIADMVEKGRQPRAIGDRNGSVKYPERRPSGDRHTWSSSQPRGHRGRWAGETVKVEFE